MLKSVRSKISLEKQLTHVLYRYYNFIYIETVSCGKCYNNNNNNIKTGVKYRSTTRISYILTCIICTG